MGAWRPGDSELKLVTQCGRLHKTADFPDSQGRNLWCDRTVTTAHNRFAVVEQDPKTLPKKKLLVFDVAICCWAKGKWGSSTMEMESASR